MTKVVLDASAALAWLLPSQATALADGLLERADGLDFIAPHIFTWEVTNVLAAKARGGDFAPVEALRQLDAVEIDFDRPLDGPEIRQLLDVSIVSGISLFDAAYLALAIELNASLASRDGPLLTAAIAAGVDVFDLRG